MVRLMNPASGSTTGGIRSGVFEASSSANAVPKQTCDAAIETSPVSEARKAKTKGVTAQPINGRTNVRGYHHLHRSTQYAKFMGYE